MSARKWWLERRRLAGGDRWRLRTGRGAGAPSINLGRVSVADAERALDALHRAEASGDVARLMAWYAEDGAEAVAWLIGDPEYAHRLEARVDYGSLPLEDYVPQVFGPHRAKDRPASWAREEWVLDQVGKVLGRERVRDIDAHMVADYLDTLVCRHGRRKGRPMAGNTKRLYRAAVQAVLHHAHRQRHIDSEPSLAMFRIRDSTTPVLSKPDPLSLDELVRLMDASEPKHRAMWAVGGGQGLRPSELMRLDWRGVDWGDRTLDPAGRKTRAAPDLVPLVPLAYAELRVWWVRSGQPREGLIFPSRSGGAYQYGGYKGPLATAARKAKIGRPVTPKILRDSCATICWSLGIPRDVTRRLLRHVDERMLQTVYERPRPSDLVERVAAFAMPEDPHPKGVPEES